MKVRTLKRRTMTRMERDHRVRLLRQLGASARCFSAAAYSMAMHMRQVERAAATLRSAFVNSYAVAAGFCLDPQDDPSQKPHAISADPMSA